MDPSKQGIWEDSNRWSITLNYGYWFNLYFPKYLNNERGYNL